MLESLKQCVVFFKAMTLGRKSLIIQYYSLIDVPSLKEKYKYFLYLTFLFCVFKWSTPSEVLQSFRAEELWIAPPQFYELSRICRFPLLNDLHNFSIQRATEGCEQWLPIISKDGHSRVVSLLPGAACPSYLSPIQTLSHTSS